MFYDLGQRGRIATVKVNVSTGGDVQLPVLWAWDNLWIRNLVLLPFAAWTEDGSNYWSLTLERFDPDGTQIGGIPVDTFMTSVDLDAYTLAVGTPLVLPHAGGDIGARLGTGETLYLNVVETGTAADLKLFAQVVVTAGDQ